MHLPVAGATLLLLSSIACWPGSVMAQAKDDALVDSCRGVMKAAEPARRTWLQRDLFAYEINAALGASTQEMDLYKENLIETCMRVAYNNQWATASGSGALS